MIISVFRVVSALLALSQVSAHPSRNKVVGATGIDGGFDEVFESSGGAPSPVRSSRRTWSLRQKSDPSKRTPSASGLLRSNSLMPPNSGSIRGDRRQLIRSTPLILPGILKLSENYNEIFASINRARKDGADIQLLHRVLGGTRAELRSTEVRDTGRVTGAILLDNEALYLPISIGKVTKVGRFVRQNTGEPVKEPYDVAQSTCRNAWDPIASKVVEISSQIELHFPLSDKAVLASTYIISKTGFGLDKAVLPISVIPSEYIDISTAKQLTCGVQRIWKSIKKNCVSLPHLTLNSFWVLNDGNLGITDVHGATQVCKRDSDPTGDDRSVEKMAVNSVLYCIWCGPKESDNESNSARCQPLPLDVDVNTLDYSKCQGDSTMIEQLKEAMIDPSAFMKYSGRKHASFCSPYFSSRPTLHQ